jgi:hypothetical protein
MAHENKRRARRLGVAHEVVGGRAHLRDGAGRSLERGGPDRLDGIDGDDAGRRARFKRGEHVFDARGRSERNGCIAQPHARGAHAHLRHRLFAGDVDRLAAGFRIGRKRLQDQGRFADAGIAAHQQRGTGNEAAAAHAVEFGNAGRPSRRHLILGLEIFERERPAPHALNRAGPCRRRGSDFLDDGVPAAARVALAGPFGVNRSAALANEARLRARH